MSNAEDTSAQRPKYFLKNGLRGLHTVYKFELAVNILNIENFHVKL